jgi:hypothetical protein
VQPYLHYWFTDPPTAEGVQKVLADAIENDRNAIIKKDVMRSILYVVLAFGAIYFLLKQRISVTGFSGILIAIILLDLGLVDSRYLNDSVYKKPEDKSFLSETPADTEILKDKDPNFRVLNLQDPFNEARTSYFHKSIGGYHGAKMRRYQDVISAHLIPEIQQIIKDQGINTSNSRVLSMLNTKYLMAGYQANAVIPNPNANGPAWIVDEVKVVNSPDEEINAIGNVDLKSVAVVDGSKFSVIDVSTDSTASIRLTHYQPNKLVYEANVQAEKHLLYSQKSTTQKAGRHLLMRMK